VVCGILAGLLFGWAHVDEEVPARGFDGAVLGLLLVNTVFGIAFGWLYWKQGLESAILAHFIVDAVGSCIVVPAYLSENPWVGVPVTIGLLLAAVGSWRALTSRATRSSAIET